MNGSAEATGLSEHSVDFVTAAQAFHWFDKEAFKVECQRILKPRGNFMIIWNTRDYQQGVIKE